MGSSVRAAAFLLLLSVDALAQSPRVALEPFLNGLNQPVYLTNAHDGSNRRFILEQPGRILVAPANSALTTVFLDIRARVLGGDEQGLLGLAFHPQFSANRRFFVNYTRRPDGATVVAEYRLLPNSAHQGDPNSEVVLLLIPQPYANHNGGMIEFGPDNFLYVGMGDGGAGNDPENRAQNRAELLGKILRIDVDRPASSAVRYTSPPTNPFFGAIPGRDEIFAYGFRNPWRFSFDRLTGELYAGDVGQSAREEIDLVALGGNYGWRAFEGTLCSNLDTATCPTLASIPPVTQYANGQLGRCSVTGGYVYRGTRRSLPYGGYVFGDFCTGEIFMFQNGVQSLLLDTALNISSFGQDETGEIYVVGLSGVIQHLANPDALSVSQEHYSIPARGGASLPSNGTGLDLTVGYARIQAEAGKPVANGLAIFGLRQGGILISEGSVAAAPLIQSGRIYAAVTALTNTGIAIANPGSAPVTVSFHFTDALGQDFRPGTVVLSPGSKIAAFLNESPFDGGSISDGTFTFRASAPVAAIALRGLLNQRTEFLMTTLPIVPLATGAGITAVFPQWAHGGGWTTDFVLVNPFDEVLSGSIDLRKPNGEPWLSLPYVVQARSSRRIVPPLLEDVVRVGSGSIVPAIGPPPSGIAIFRYATEAGEITEAGVPSMPAGTAFRGYGEVSKLVRTGLAVTNLSLDPATVTVSLTSLDGSASQTGTLSLAAMGQSALFLDEIPGLTTMVSPFQGIVRVTSPQPIGVTALRTRVNERGEFLITASVPSDESTIVPGPEMLFPHLAVGGGYDVQLVLFGFQQAATPTGTILFYSETGVPMSLLLP